MGQAGLTEPLRAPARGGDDACPPALVLDLWCQTSRARRQTLPECQCPMVWDLKQTSVEEEQPERAAMFLIHFVRCSVVSQRKVKA